MEKPESATCRPGRGGSPLYLSLIHILGYVFGLFQTGFIYGRSKGIDIRQHGSGNSGSTNALRVMGVKAGLIVFLGDFLKTVIPCFLVRILFRSQPGYIYVLILCAGLSLIHI